MTFSLYQLYPDQNINEIAALKETLHNETVIYHVYINKLHFATVQYEMIIEPEKYIVEVDIKAELSILLKNYHFESRTEFSKDLRSINFQSTKMDYYQKRTEINNYSYLSGLYNSKRRFYTKKDRFKKEETYTVSETYPFCDENLFILLLRILYQNIGPDSYHFVYQKKLNTIEIKKRENKESSNQISGIVINDNNKKLTDFEVHLSHEQSHTPIYGEVTMWFGKIWIEAVKIIYNDQVISKF